MKVGKAQGQDGILGKIIKLMVNLRPQIFLDLYNTCLTTGTFSDRWKTARLVLISKDKGDLSSPSAYRPLSLLDTLGKMYDHLLRPRLTDTIRNAGGLSDQQFRFRRSRLTIGAIQMVVDVFQDTDRHCHAAGPIELLATLDVKIAFNSVRWVDILESLKSDFRIPPCLLLVIKDYLRNRQITYETTEGQVTR